MRLALGPGYYSMWGDADEGSMSLQAPGGGLNLAIGAALVEDLVLFGEVSLQTTLDPDVDASGSDASRPGTSVTTVAAGAGIGYHFVPSQVYVSGSLLAAQARAVDRATERLLGKTNLGPALALAVGKDWWLSPSWMLGVLVRAQVASLKDPKRGRSGATWGSLGLSALFCVAFE